MSISSGIHDPYWYEATVRQEYLLKMLDEKSDIESVTFQKTSASALDDVVIKFKTSKQRCIQVKHSRIDTNFTFTSLFLPLQESLFAKLFFDWIEEDSSNKTEVILYTNRGLGDQDSTVEISDEKLQVPSVKKCYEFLKTTSILESEDEKIKNFLRILKLITKDSPDSKILEFKNHFEIQYSQLALDDYKEKIQDEICKIFGCNASGAAVIHSRLDHALRKWATTSRGKDEEVNRDAVLKELSLIEDEQVGQHEIPPPSPFFESRQKFSFIVEESINTSDLNYFFITGDAGSGKSSVVSYMCNRPNPAFDLRFHAFLPLQASGLILPLDSEKTVTPKVFWTDLLIQLKRKLKGSLSKYNLPILTSNLSWEVVRNYVLLTLEKIAEVEDRYVSIVIDGIDHAARSKMNLTFLETLPLPSKSKSKIKLVLVGQPPNSYPQYPLWLRESREDVLRFYIPSIEVEDIEALLLSRKDLKIEHGEIHAAAIEIQSRVMGNTLSAVFAIEETVNCTNVEEIGRCLLDRKLTGNLASYYEEIWQRTVQKIPNHKEVISSALALVFSTFKTRPSAEFFFEALNDLNITVAEWKNIFLNLGPLIIKDQVGYRVLHNDVRIFLVGFTNLNQEIVNLVAIKISDYLQKTKDFKLLRQNDLVGLINNYDNKEALLSLINDEFVFEGFVLQKSESQMADEVFELFNIQLNTEFNLEHILNSLLVSKTIQSVDVSMDTYEIPKISLKIYDGSFLKSECKVSRKDQWNVDILKSFLKDCGILYRTNYVERSKALFNRWIEETSDLTFLENFELDEVYERWGKGEEKELTKEFLLLVENLGYYSLCFDRWDLFEKALELKKINNELIHAVLVKGGLKALVGNKKNARKIIYLMRSIHSYFVDDFVCLIEKKFLSNEFLSIKFLLKHFLKKDKELPLRLIILLAFAETMLGERGKFLDLVMQDDFINTRWSDEGISHPERYLCYLVIINSIINKNRPIQGIVEDILLATKYKNHEPETIKSLKKLMYLSGLVSRTIIISPDHPGLFFDTNETLTLLEHVLDTSKSNFRSYIKDKHFIVEMCISILGNGIENVSYESFEEVKKLFLRQLEYERYYWAKPWLMKFLLKGDSAKAVVDNLKSMFSSDSYFWSLEPNERSDFIRFVDQLKNEGLEIDLAEVSQRNRLGLFHPSSHKDYTLIELEETLGSLLKKYPEKWKTIGLEALAVSIYYDSIGDNRLHWSIKKSLAIASIRCGANDFFNLLNLTCNDERLFHYNEGLIIESITEALKNLELAEADLVFLWEYCRSILPYGETDVTEKLSNLKSIFLKFGNEKGYLKFIEFINSDNWIKFIEVNATTEAAAVYEKNIQIPFSDLLEEVKEYAQGNSEYDTVRRDLFKNNFKKLLIGINGRSTKDRGIIIENLQNVILNLRQRYSLRNSGLGDLFEVLTDEMTLEELENYYKRFYKHFLNSEKLSFWADILREDLKTFLFAFMKKMNVDEIVVGRLVKNSWDLIDAFKTRDIKRLEVKMNECHVESWISFYLSLSSKLLTCTIAEVQVESWKSLTRTMFMYPDHYKHFVENWNSLDDELKIKIVGILEVSKWHDKSFYSVYCKDILSLAVDKNESVEIRAAASLCGGTNLFEDFKMNYQIYEKFTNLPVGPNQIFEIDSQKLGLSYFTNEYSTFKTKLSMADLVLEGLDTTTVEKKVARLRIKKKTKPDTFCIRGYNSIDLIKNDNLQLLHEAIEDEIARGNATPVTTAAFLQFLLNGDDPSFLVFDEKYLSLDFELDDIKNYENLGDNDRANFQNKINEYINSFLASDESVLSSTINLFSNKFDFIIKFDQVLKIPLKKQSKKTRESMFGGRGGYLVSPFHLDELNVNDEIIMCEYGGLFKFQKFSFITYPKNSFVEKLKLKPMNDNPFILHNEESGAVLSFQRINLHGKEKIRSPYYRMSYIDQWIMNDICEEKIIEIYKRNLRGEFIIKIGEFENN